MLGHASGQTTAALHSIVIMRRYQGSDEASGRSCTCSRISEAAALFLGTSLLQGAANKAADARTSPLAAVPGKWFMLAVGARDPPLPADTQRLEPADLWSLQLETQNSAGTCVPSGGKKFLVETKTNRVFLYCCVSNISPYMSL